MKYSESYYRLAVYDHLPTASNPTRSPELGHPPFLGFIGARRTRGTGVELLSPKAISRAT